MKDTYTKVGTILLNISFVFLALAMFIDYERKIETLELSVDKQNYQIDSLINEIDTLLSKQVQDYVYPTTDILSAIIHVESSGRDSAYCASEDAVGCMQIRRTMVRDVNRILKRRKSDKRYKLKDRWNRNKSIEMFNIYCSHYGLESNEEKARCWNGGPRGDERTTTLGYWNKVKNYLDS